MQIVKKLRVFDVTKANCVDAEALFDTGASGTFMSEDLANRLGFVKYEKPITIKLAVKDKEATVIGFGDYIFNINGFEILHFARTVPNLASDIVVGIDMIELHGIELDTKKGEVTFKKGHPLPLSII